MKVVESAIDEAGYTYGLITVSSRLEDLPEIENISLKKVKG